MDIMRELLSRKQLIQAEDEGTMAWIKNNKIFCAFNQSGDMLASGQEYTYLSKEGKLLSNTTSDGRMKLNIPEEKKLIEVLYFIPSDLDLQKYDSQKFLLKKGIPLPLDFQVKEIQCRDDIFTIFPKSQHQEITGAFSIMRTAVGMVEALYLNNGVTEYIINQCYYYYLEEDHKNYLEDQKKINRKRQKRPDGRWQTLDRKDFTVTDTGDYECEFTQCLWGKEADIYANYEGSPEDMELALTDYASQLDSHIKWIQEHKEVIQKAVLDDDMVELACDWMEGCEVEGEDGKTYYELEDGELFPCPVTEETFLNALSIEGINAGCDDDVPREVLLDLFLGTTPDFFACHSIEVFITATSDENGYHYDISVNGLAG